MICVTVACNSSVDSSLEQLDRIAVRIFDLNLFAAGADLHFISKTQTRLFQVSDARRQILHLEKHTVPSARLLLTAIGSARGRRHSDRAQHGHFLRAIGVEHARHGVTREKLRPLRGRELRTLHEVRVETLGPGCRRALRSDCRREREHRHSTDSRMKKGFIVGSEVETPAHFTMKRRSRRLVAPSIEASSRKTYAPGLRVASGRVNVASAELLFAN